MVIGPQGELPLPWLRAALAAALPQLRGHGTLLHAHAGDGAFEFALSLAAAWLCEDDSAAPRPCGHCGSCRLIQARLHPDLLVVLPEALRRELGWPLSGDKAEDGDAEEGRGKRKASRQVRIDEVRLAIDWIVTTPSRGRVKVLLLHPATAMNVHAANALLKMLEEPPGGARLLLTAAQPEQLLPTVRSRCQSWRLAVPQADEATRWLEGQGLAAAARLLAAADGHPLLAREWHAAGLTAEDWQGFPAAVVQGRVKAGQWGVSLLLHALRCLCHDLQCRLAGASPRYFAPETLASAGDGDMTALTAWQSELLHSSRLQDHPWSEALLAEALLLRAREAVLPSAAARRAALATLRP